MKYRLQTLAQFAVMLTLTSFATFLVWGDIAVYVLIGLLILIPVLHLQNNRSGAQLLNRLDARPLYNTVYDNYLRPVVKTLAHRAGLDHMPRVYIVPKRVANAFTIGSQKDSTVVLTAGLLQHLNAQEVEAVLAHEIAHVKNGDLELIRVGYWLSQVASFLAFVAQWTFLFSLPFFLAEGNAFFPALAALILVVSIPTINRLLQSAMSRTREFAADETAAAITGAPLALASALYKIENHETTRRSWFEVLLGLPTLPKAPKTQGDDLWRSHPATDQRIERLQGNYQAQSA